MAGTRTHYRIVYPIAERPRVIAWGATHAVLDIAESGLRLQLGGDTVPEPGGAFWGKLLLRDDEVVEIGGYVVRVHEGEVAVHLEPETSIPFKVVMAEQRYLRAHYPLLQ